jgi:hypothetical protein
MSDTQTKKAVEFLPEKHEGPPLTSELQIEHSESMEYNEVAYEVLCKLLDKLNTDIEELVSRLKTSLDQLDRMDAARKNE